MTSENPLVMPQDEFELTKQAAEWVAAVTRDVEASYGVDWKARAEKAEATLAAVRERLSAEHGSWIRIPVIQAITGSGGGKA